MREVHAVLFATLGTVALVSLYVFFGGFSLRTDGAVDEEGTTLSPFHELKNQIREVFRSVQSDTSGSTLQVGAIEE